MRAVFDVAVLIRATFGSHLVIRLLRQANNGTFELVWAEPLVQELIETSQKPRLTDRVNRVVLDEIIAFLKEESRLVFITPPYPKCRDPDDEYLLAIARDGDADYLVTNDQDLLCLSNIAKCLIVTPEEFASRVTSLT